MLLVEVTRGPLVESRHYGHVAVVDGRGDIKYSAGDPHYFTYMRSSAKPLQVIPVIESGAARHFGFSKKQLAVMTGSHAGEDIHTTAVESILQDIGLRPEHLMCGTQWPFHRPTTERLRREGLEPGLLHNNCSGKHSAMLALAVFRGYSIENYLSPDHPVQTAMLNAVSEMCGVSPKEVMLGIDGCGVPVFGMPLSAMATGFARLVSPDQLPPIRAEACRAITGAMQAFPEMVSGSRRLDTELMLRTSGMVVAKIGAEAIHCCGIPELGLGMAVKIEDGGERAIAPTVIEVLKQIGILAGEQLQALRKFLHPEVMNRRGEVVGAIRPAFKLQSGKV